MAEIALSGVTKEFPGPHVALAGVDLTIADGERLALVGPSGSGKSTLLRVVAGLELPSSGRIAIGGRDVTDVPPEDRDLAMVFQSYALYPHMSVRDNLAFGLRMRRLPRREIDRRVTAMADALGLRPLLERRPGQLSGGQRQRVALGRALVREPQAFLFDEPLSNLDPQRRTETRAELVQLHDRLRATMVYVTHDQEEAMTLGQRIAVLRNGRVEQVATPDVLYAAPANTFVAAFIGSPSMNLVPASAAGPLALAQLPRNAETVGVRPHDVRIRRDEAASGAYVTLVEPLGHTTFVHVRLDALRLLGIAEDGERLAAGDAVRVTVARGRTHVFDGTGRRLAVEADEFPR